GFDGIDDARPLLSNWSKAVRRSLKEKPPRTRTGWKKERWRELAEAFTPGEATEQEKHCLYDLLHSLDDRRLGALPTLWQLQAELNDDGLQEEKLHDLLEQRKPAYGPLLEAIRAYEAFARSLQDAFDVLKAEAATVDSHGFSICDIAKDKYFQQCVQDLHGQFERAHHTLGAVALASMSLQNLFSERFGAFAEPLDAGKIALVLCSHHEVVQRGKSADGKRPWFDRIGPDRIYIRHAYRQHRRNIQPGCYVHEYRGKPVRRFYKDLT
ncbi:hypothetical protein ACFL6U_21185, partial [Planctomycetota bacterium]